MSKAAYKQAIAAQANAVNASNANTTEERKAPEFWINVGTVNEAGEFLSLPYGIGLDTMMYCKEDDNAEPNYMKEVKNSLLDYLREQVANMPTGSEMSGDEFEDIPLTVRIRRTGKPSSQNVVRGKELLMQALKKRT